MTTFINTSVTAPSISHDIFIFDDVSGYFVTATVGDISHNTITFGNGNFDSVTTEVGDISHNTIALGNGDFDLVQVFGSSSHDAIALGNGVSDGVTVGGSSRRDAIALGNGGDDFVVVGGSSRHDAISLGNGIGDSVRVFGGSSHDLIIVGNGNLDQITLNAPSSGTATGGDTIITGTGNSDTVNVAAHTLADTFGFALGTGATALSQTIVTGARVGDQVAVGNNSGLVLTNGEGLGNTLVQKGAVGGLTTVNGFITFLGVLTKGDTYTADSGGNTFIVTDTSNGHVCGVEIVGVFEHNSIAHHQLTLG